MKYSSLLLRDPLIAVRCRPVASRVHQRDGSVASIHCVRAIYACGISGCSPLDLSVFQATDQASLGMCNRNNNALADANTGFMGIQYISQPREATFCSCLSFC